jgi:hypothetical protein
MARFRSGDQPDLFANTGDILRAEAPPSDFIDLIRDELTGTLARVRETAVLPWKDLTAATLAELRFNSIAGWLSLRNHARGRDVTLRNTSPAGGGRQWQRSIARGRVGLLQRGGCRSPRPAAKPAVAASGRGWGRGDSRTKIGCRDSLGRASPRGRAPPGRQRPAHRGCACRHIPPRPRNLDREAVQIG